MLGGPTTSQGKILVLGPMTCCASSSTCTKLWRATEHGLRRCQVSGCLVHAQHRAFLCYGTHPIPSVPQCMSMAAPCSLMRSIRFHKDRCSTRFLSLFPPVRPLPFNIALAQLLGAVMIPFAPTGRPSSANLLIHAPTQGCAWSHVKLVSLHLSSWHAKARVGLAGLALADAVRFLLC